MDLELGGFILEEEGGRKVVVGLVDAAGRRILF
jgi:hypothetical protein